MQIRREFLEQYGRRIWEGPDLVLLGVTWKDPIEQLRVASGAVPTSELRWHDLAECEAHPRREEFARYYAWKAEHSQP